MKKIIFVLFLMCLAFVFIGCSPSSDSVTPPDENSLESLTQNKEVKIPDEVKDMLPAIGTYQMVEKIQKEFEGKEALQVYKTIEEIMYNAFSPVSENESNIITTESGLKIKIIEDKKVFALECDNLKINDQYSISMDFDSAMCVVEGNNTIFQGTAIIDYAKPEELSLEFNGKITPNDEGELEVTVDFYEDLKVVGIDRPEQIVLSGADFATMQMFGGLSWWLGSDYGLAYDFMAILSEYDEHIKQYNDDDGLSATILKDAVKLSFTDYDYGTENITGNVDFKFELKDDIPVVKLVIPSLKIGDDTISTDGLYVFYNLPIGGSIKNGDAEYSITNIQEVMSILNDQDNPISNLITVVSNVVEDVLISSFSSIDLSFVLGKTFNPLGSKSMAYQFDKIDFLKDPQYPTIDKTIWISGFEVPGLKIDSIHGTSKNNMTDAASKIVSNGNTYLFIINNGVGGGFINNQYAGTDWSF